MLGGPSQIVKWSISIPSLARLQWLVVLQLERLASPSFTTGLHKLENPNLIRQGVEVAFSRGQWTSFFIMARSSEVPT